MPFIPNTEEEKRSMLKDIGVDKFEELLVNIPENVRLKGSLKLPEPLSEFEVTKALAALADKNRNLIDTISFLGGGAYDHYIPAAIGHITSRSEFYTAYTPYQPEVSQGTLQVIYEYQSLICRLFGMDASNASMYDGASALAEAALLAYNHTGRKKIVVSASVHPYYLDVLRTYCHGQSISVKVVGTENGCTDVSKLRELVGETTAAVIVQHPNFFGNLEQVTEISALAHEAGALLIASVDPISLGILQPPSTYDADIATGEGQALGNSISFGGPYLGIFTAKKELVRKMPGRIAGLTEDTQGRRGFVLTYQTREQHIRREKATSNICTNQALNALAATVYLSLMGKFGIKRVANLCLQKSHYLAERIAQLPGFELTFSKPFFKEFVVSTPLPAEDILRTLLDKKIFGGIALARFFPELKNRLLISVTEKRTKEEMDIFLSCLSEFK